MAVSLGVCWLAVEHISNLCYPGQLCVAPKVLAVDCWQLKYHFEHFVNTASNAVVFLLWAMAPM
jgi:hypothetical protein